MKVYDRESAHKYIEVLEKKLATAREALSKIAHYERWEEYRRTTPEIAAEALKTIGEE